MNKGYLYWDEHEAGRPTKSRVHSSSRSESRSLILMPGMSDR